MTILESSVVVLHAHDDMAALLGREMLGELECVLDGAFLGAEAIDQTLACGIDDDDPSEITRNDADECKCRWHASRVSNPRATRELAPFSRLDRGSIMQRA